MVLFYCFVVGWLVGLFVLNLFKYRITHIPSIMCPMNKLSAFIYMYQCRTGTDSADISRTLMKIQHEKTFQKTCQLVCQPISVSNMGVKHTDPLRALWPHYLEGHMYLRTHLKLIVFLRCSPMLLHFFTAVELQHGCLCQVTQDTSHKAEN